MRTATLVALSLTTAATLASAKKDEGGALEALLERMQTKKHEQHDKRALRDSSSELDYSDKGASYHGATNSSPRAHRQYAAEHKGDKKVAKTLGRPHPVHDSSSSSDAKSRKGSNADSDKHSKKKGQEKSFGKKHDEKRWVWGTAIIQDDTPAASDVPAIGQNANYLIPAPVNTPDANLVAPSFPPLVAPSFPPLSVASTEAVIAPSPSSSSSSSQTPPAVSSSSSQTPPAASSSSAAARRLLANRKKPAHTTTPAAAQTPAAAKDKRYIWATSIIQDGDENVPPVGDNANLLSSATIALNTPVAQLTPPSFPPVAATTTSSVSVPVETPSTAGQENGAEQAAQIVASASSTLSAAVADLTSPATAMVGGPAIQSLLVKIQSELDALAQVYHQATATQAAVDAAAETSPAENAKRWVWGKSIIQDNSPSSGLPPIGQNTNLLNPSIQVATPTATLVPPTPTGKLLPPNFAGRIGLATGNGSAPPATDVPVPPVAAETPVAPASQSPVAIADTLSPAASPVSSPAISHAPLRNRKSEADSIRSVRDAAAHKTSAALEWHLVNQKRKVGGMAKQHKRH
ncbi:uncharacterized protein JCM15063_004311 [Sporobolomyces koalae]|uniref:uncharacterized protein n=1 Tax=Sporobolomyces koalae TaxID=500713 RepID=UPI00317BFE29